VSCGKSYPPATKFKPFELPLLAWVFYLLHASLFNWVHRVRAAKRLTIGGGAPVITILVRRYRFISPLHL
jgi:hypothetical protein